MFIKTVTRANVRSIRISTGGRVLFRDLQIKIFPDKSKFILFLLFFTLLNFDSSGKIYSSGLY